MIYSKRLRQASAILAIAAAGTISTAASASPPVGVITSEIFVTANLDEDGHSNTDRIKFQTKDPTDVRFQRLTFAAGANTGWHHHGGLVIVAVASGTLTLLHSNCTDPTVYPAGSVFIESDDEAHRATAGASGAVLLVTYVVPDGAPFRIEDPVPFCATSF